MINFFFQISDNFFVTVPESILGYLDLSYTNISLGAYFIFKSSHNVVYVFNPSHNIVYVLNPNGIYFFSSSFWHVLVKSLSII